VMEEESVGLLKSFFREARERKKQGGDHVKGIQSS